MNGKRVALVLSLMFSLVCLYGYSSAVSQAQSSPVLADDFNDNFLDPAVWEPFKEALETTTSELNGRLEMTRLPGSLGGGVKTACEISGDFDARVDYDLLIWPLFGQGNGIRVGLAFAPNYLVGRTSFSSLVADFPSAPSREVYLTDFGASQAGDPDSILASMVSTTDLGGRLRLVREGSTLSGYFFDPTINDWVLLQTKTNMPTEDVQLVLNVFPFGPVPSEVKVAFDNFVVSADGVGECKPVYAFEAIKNGAFESGDLAGWTTSGINGGVAGIVQEGACFSSNNTTGLTLKGDFAVNVRSSASAPINSIGVLTSEPFVAGSAIRFRALSENDDAVPVADPVTLEVQLLDVLGNALLSEVVTTNIVTLSPGTFSVFPDCLAGEPRDGTSSTHVIDTAAVAGRTVKLEFRQHTNVSGKGFFTLIDNVERSVPLFKQDDQGWGESEYDDGDSQSIDCGTTLTQCGCATTAAAMILQYYGVTHAPLPIPVGQLETSPFAVNEYFRLDGQPATCNDRYGSPTPGWVSRGYMCGRVRWGAVAEYSRKAYERFETQMIAFNGVGDYNPTAVRQDIYANDPVILRVPGPQHWVVATGIAGDTFTINDPLHNRTRLNDSVYGNTFLKMRRYIRTASDFSAIEVGVVAPAQVLITDPNGNRTGFDPVTLSVVQEIPNSTYFFDEALADDTGENPPPPTDVGNHWAVVTIPQAGVYEVEVIVPTNTGYTFAVYASDSDANLSLNVFEGQPPPGTLDHYTFAYDPTAGAATIALQIPIDIKPGSDPNCFNNNGHGVITVAILSSNTFNATQVDPTTVKLDGQDVRVVGKGNTQAHAEDVNNDGLYDLVVQIEDRGGTYEQGNAAATLRGKLLPDFGEMSIEGADAICIVP